MAEASHASGLTDTDILIDGARGVSHAVNYLTQRQRDGLLQISIVTAMELISGCRDKLQLVQTQQLVAAIPIWPISSIISQTAYRLMETYHLSHGLLLPDALIGATCLEHRLALITRNVRHFQMIPQLMVEKPY